MFGIVLISDGITEKFIEKSLLNEIIRNKKNLISFFNFNSWRNYFRGVAQWLGKLWIYPYFDTYSYFVFFIFGFGFYWLMITESYLAIKAILDYVYREKIL